MNNMKFKQAIAIGAFGCISFAAIAQQQQSPFITPAPVTQSAAGGPIVLNLTGVTVTDTAGQPVGPIQHILLSPAGCVDMAVLSLGAQRLVPVPWTLVSSAGAGRGETDVAGREKFALKVDRTVLQQAPTITMNQLSQPQMVQQVKQYFVQYEQQSAAGGTTSQSGINVGAGTGTNQVGAGLTNAASGSNTNASTNQTGILSPTGPTNAAPGRPAFETNRPAQPSIIPPGRPENRPPANRPPANRPPTNTPGPGAGAPGGATPNSPGL
jgi:hypothetical protein